MTTTKPSFEIALHEPPPEGKRDFIRDEWDSVRDAGIEPRSVSGLSDDSSLRAEFMSGAVAMGLVGRKKSLKPQQLLCADVLNSNQKFTSILMPRRSSKTTSILAWAIGRCLSREDYMIAYTLMTTGKKARDRFLKDILPILTRVFPDPKTAPFVVRKGSGQERIEFRNGSIFQILAPIGDDFRSEAFDVIILDEAGEAEPENTEDVLGAALPTMDTREGAMLVVAGTAAKFQDGNLLWDELEKGRSGAAKYAVLDFSAPDGTKLREGMEWDEVEPLVLGSHPGVSNLTPLSAVADNFDRMKLDQFGREYLGMFGKTGISSLFDLDAWAKLASADAMPKPPGHFRIGFAVHKKQTSASVVAAWREKDGKARVLVLAHVTRLSTLYPKLVKLARLHRVPLVVDGGNSVNMVEIEKLQRARPKPALEIAQWNQVAASAAGMLKEIEDGNMVHFDQEQLNNSIRCATRRASGTTKQWAFGKLSEDDDITALEAASVALRAYDNAPKKAAPLRLIV